ncbi:PREDICTED: RCC1 and BTB domain-containing protein 1-like [Eufriesea mexicana]|uniref:RCC1 and BTB domain-containing protein 1-like n=1 Tax=Eufriesea mexicana TaxID=516756 RepID=UPI00083C0423|nr:PREDICTED: RCC1 and BTB domain-containing protein 1-like [Eufriesea mexicana]
MSTSNLKNWPIFSFLDSDFISNIHMVFVYGDLGNEALIVTKDKMVYALGSNTSGCLGIGDTNSTLYPRKVEELCNQNVTMFAHGKGPYVLALTEEGKVYSWGHNAHNQVGNSSAYSCLTPTLVTKNISTECIVDVACGAFHSLALTLRGNVFAWGENTYGQVGNGDTTNVTVCIPKMVNYALSDKKVVWISCCQSSSVAVTDKGEVYSWGENGVGQLGIGILGSRTVPQKVTQLNFVVISKVVCGYVHMLALSNDGDLFVWGGNSYGQLGLNTNKSVWSPVMLTVPEMGKVLDIASSHYNHVNIAMAKDNRIFIWGHCCGQIVRAPILTVLKCLHDGLAFYAYPRVMHRPLILQDHKETNLTNSLKEAFDNPTTSDLTIQVDGKNIFVHKAILRIRSQYFKMMFQEPWSENSQSVVEHKQFSYKVFKTFLEYLYTNEIDLPLENVLELLELSTVYFENRLKKCCIRIIIKGITVVNVSKWYGISIKYNDKELEEYCFKIMLKSMTAIVQTADFALLDEKTIKTFIIKVAAAGAFKT